MITHKCVVSTMTMDHLDCKEDGHFDCMYCRDCKHEYHGVKR